jgi:hypothetical protein
LLGAAVLRVRYYDLTAARFAVPDASYTGFGYDGVWYAAGVPDLGHSPQLAPWSTEVASSVRGTRNRFPDRILVVGTELELAILDADTLELWMRFLPAEDTGESYLGFESAHFGKFDFDVDRGVLYVVVGGSLRVADFSVDRMAAISSSLAVVTKEPDGTGNEGSILNRNTAGRLDLGDTTVELPAGPPAWLLSDYAQEVLVGCKLLGSPARSTVAVGTRRSLHVRASGLPRGNPPTAAPARDHVHHGPDGDWGMVKGSGGGDEVLDDDGDPTGYEFACAYDFSDGIVCRGMLFREDLGGYQPPVPVLDREGDLLTLSRETLVGHPDEWEVLANVLALCQHVDGTLGLLAGHRLVHAGETWVEGEAGADSSTLLNPSSTVPHRDLPAEVLEVYSLYRHGDYYLVCTDVGVWRVQVVSATELGVPELLYAGTPPATAERLYELLGASPCVREVAVDSRSGVLGLALSELAALSSEVPAAQADVEYDLDGLHFELDAGLGEHDVEFAGSYTADELKAALEHEVPETTWTHLGAGRWLVESLAGSLAVGDGDANSVLGFTNGATAAPAGSATLLVDTALQQVWQTLGVLSPQAEEIASVAGSSIVVSQRLVPAPAPLGLEISEPGGQVLRDDGLGAFTGDVDGNYTNEVDYETGDLTVKFAATPTGEVTLRYLTPGVVHSLASYVNPQGPPTTAL